MPSNSMQLRMPKDGQPTVVVMNPPFSKITGRLVAIVGRGMSMDAATFRDW